MAGRFADRPQVGEWLREQSGESVAALRRLLHEFVVWDRRRTSAPTAGVGPVIIWMPLPPKVGMTP